MQTSNGYRYFGRSILTRLALLPCLLLSGALAAQEDPAAAYFDVNRWESAIQAFEAQDRQQFPPAGAIVFNGSSSIFFWHENLPEDMAPLSVIPRGFGGSTLLDAIYYLDRIVLPYRPRAIVLYEGDNDIGRFRLSPQRVVELFNGYVAKVRESLPQTRIYFLAIKPSVSRWAYWREMQQANREIAAVCAADPLLTYIDVAEPLLGADGLPDASLFVEDQLHLNRRGYERWRGVVRPILLEKEAAYEPAGAVE